MGDEESVADRLGKAEGNVVDNIGREPGGES